MFTKWDVYKAITVGIFYMVIAYPVFFILAKYWPTKEERQKKRGIYGLIGGIIGLISTYASVSLWNYIAGK
ncbi:MAG: hypothetical protein ABFD64_03065 [Armatimonadota bacterium]